MLCVTDSLAYPGQRFPLGGIFLPCIVGLDLATPDERTACTSKLEENANIGDDDGSRINQNKLSRSVTRETVPERNE